jgi:tetratricopeptide (TPR) repeat protein
MSPLDIVLAPGMRIVWAISAAILLFLWRLNRRPAPDPLAAGNPITVQIPLPVVAVKPGPPMRTWAVFIATVACFLSGLVINMKSMIDHRHQSVVGWALIAVFLGSGLVISNLKQGGVRRSMECLKRGDYNRALAQADDLLRWYPGSVVYNSLRASALRGSGRLDEAEQAFAVCIALSQGKSRLAQAAGLDAMGNVWRDQGKFNQAEAAFQSAKELDPNYGTPYCGLAEVYLRRDHSPEEALRLLDEGLKLTENDKRLPERLRKDLADRWASRADALARLRRTREAEESLQKAAELADPSTIPDMAGMLWRSGEALRHMDRESEAAELFERAAQIDPQGLFGKRSAAALREQAPA